MIELNIALLNLNSPYYVVQDADGDLLFETHQCPLKISGIVCKLLKYRVLELKIDGDDLN